MNEEVMIPKSYHDKVCEEIIRFKDKQFYDAVHLLDDGTLEITVGDYTKVKRVLVEDCNNFGNLFYKNDADRPQGMMEMARAIKKQCMRYPTYSDCYRCECFDKFEEECKLGEPAGWPIDEEEGEE